MRQEELLDVERLLAGVQEQLKLPGIVDHRLVKGVRLLTAAVRTLHERVTVLEEKP